MFFCQHLWAHSQCMTIFIKWAHMVYKYFFLHFENGFFHTLWTFFAALCGNVTYITLTSSTSLPAIVQYNNVDNKVIHTTKGGYFYTHFQVYFCSHFRVYNY